MTHPEWLMSIMKSYIIEYVLVNLSKESKYFLLKFYKNIFAIYSSAITVLYKLSKRMEY